MKFKRLLTVVILVLFLTSCAYHHEIVRTPNIPLYNQTVMLNNIQYIPLLKYCEYYNLDWDWDLVSQKIKIKKNQNTMVLRPNSEYALFNNRTVALDYPVEYKNGAAYIPITTAVFMSKEVFDLKDKPVLPIRGHRIRTVVLDPGHGGKDPGAISRYGTREKDIVLDVARRLKKDLERNGLTVLMTRNSDIFIPLKDRPRYANKRDADLFISVHANAARSRSARGFEVYYLSEATDDTARALALAENASLKLENTESKAYASTNPVVWDLILSENRRQSKELAYYICNITSDRLDMKKRGVKGAKFAVLKGADMPAVLVEVGFLTNRREESNLKRSSFRDKLADAISRSILSYKRQYERTNGFTE